MDKSTSYRIIRRLRIDPAFQKGFSLSNFCENLIRSKDITSEKQGILILNQMLEWGIIMIDVNNSTQDFQDGFQNNLSYVWAKVERIHIPNNYTWHYSTPSVECIEKAKQRQCSFNLGQRSAKHMNDQLERGNSCIGTCQYSSGFDPSKRNVGNSMRSMNLSLNQDSAPKGKMTAINKFIFKKSGQFSDANFTKRSNNYNNNMCTKNDYFDSSVTNNGANDLSNKNKDLIDKNSGSSFDKSSKDDNVFKRKILLDEIMHFKTVKPTLFRTYSGNESLKRSNCNNNNNLNNNNNNNNLNKDNFNSSKDEGNDNNNNNNNNKECINSDDRIRFSRIDLIKNKIKLESKIRPMDSKNNHPFNVNINENSTNKPLNDTNISKACNENTFNNANTHSSFYKINLDIGDQENYLDVSGTSESALAYQLSRLISLLRGYIESLILEVKGCFDSNIFSDMMIDIFKICDEYILLAYEEKKKVKGDVNLMFSVLKDFFSTATRVKDVEKMKEIFKKFLRIKSKLETTISQEKVKLLPGEVVEWKVDRVKLNIPGVSGFLGDMLLYKKNILNQKDTCSNREFNNNNNNYNNSSMNSILDGHSIFKRSQETSKVVDQKIDDLKSSIKGDSNSNLDQNTSSDPQDDDFDPFSHSNNKDSNIYQVAGEFIWTNFRIVFSSPSICDNSYYSSKDHLCLYYFLSQLIKKTDSLSYKDDNCKDNENNVNKNSSFCFDYDNYQLCPLINHSISLGLIMECNKVNFKKTKMIQIITKDQRVLYFDFSPSKCKFSALKRFREFQRSNPFNLFCWELRKAIQSNLNNSFLNCGWDFYVSEKEYKRMGMNDSWLKSTINSKYEICDTYPDVLWVPAACSELNIVISSNYRSRNRFPVLAYYYYNGAAITRSSQPASGVGGKRCKGDENLLYEIGRCNPNSKRVCIFDARPKSNAIANKAMGYGYEMIQNYHNCTLQFCDIENIHVMRNSLAKFREALWENEAGSFMADVVSSGWLTHQWQLIYTSLQIVHCAGIQALSVLVHCSDGWDRTSQLISLSSIMLDPFYRTLDGFITLIEKDWLSFGHRFSTRHGYEGNTSSDNRAPIFHQFIEIIWQFQQQFPQHFQFNETFLIHLLDSVYSCHYGTFLFNNFRDRKVNEVEKKSLSAWLPYMINPTRQQFINKDYTPFNSVLLMTPSDRHLKIWERFYLRYHPTQRPIPNWYEKMSEKIVLVNEKLL